MVMLAVAAAETVAILGAIDAVAFVLVHEILDGLIRLAQRLHHLLDLRGPIRRPLNGEMRRQHGTLAAHQRRARDVEHVEGEVRVHAACVGRSHVWHIAHAHR